MPLNILIALAAVATTPAEAPRAATSRPPASAPAKAKASPAVDPMQAMAMMMKMFDKFFPAGPAPDPARLAMAREATMTMFPKGAYAEAMNIVMNRTVDQALNMSEADFAGMVPLAKDKKAKPPSTEPLRLMLSKKDPTFDAKLAAVRAFAGTMLTKVGDVAEPKFREGMARALARKFDERQLADVRAFLATPTGAAYGREMVGLWFQPDVMRGAFEMFPEMIKLMPALAKDAAELSAQLKPAGKPTDKKPE
ncbi:MAG: hypothetical protein ABIO43_13505 [Sphingomicrobium sp.]